MTHLPNVASIHSTEKMYLMSLSNLFSALFLDCSSPPFIVKFAHINSSPPLEKVHFLYVLISISPLSSLALHNSQLQESDYVGITNIHKGFKYL